MSGKSAIYVDSSIEYLRFNELLTPEEDAIRKHVRKFAETEIAPYINDYVERAEFPEFLLPKIREVNLFDYFLKAPYGKGLSS